MPISNNVRTNIPVIRKPFGAELPPRVPYIMEENVGSAIGNAQAVCVEGRRIVPVTASMGGAKKAIYLENGIFREGDSFTDVTIIPQYTEGVNIAQITIDGVTYNIKAPSSISSVTNNILRTPLLTPMWFDHRTTDVTWIPTLDASGNWIEYSKSSGVWKAGTSELDARTQAGCQQVYEHIRADYAGGSNVNDAYSNGTTIACKKESDGHKICATTQVDGLNAIYNATDIGTAWYFVLNTTEGSESFRLPRTRYSFHGNLSHVKMPYEEPNANITMMLYFHVNGGVTDSFDSFFDIMYPVGTIYTSAVYKTVGELPSLFRAAKSDGTGNRDWEIVGTGRCLWGCESNQELGATGKSILPNHIHHIPTSESDALGNVDKLSTARHGSYVGSNGYNNCQHVAYTDVIATRSGGIISAWPSTGTSNSNVTTGNIVRPPIYTVTFFRRIA